MKSKIHSIFIYPLISLFAYLLKGTKENYDDFLTDNTNRIKRLEFLNINSESHKNSFFQDIKYFFDKKSPLYDKTFVNIYVDLEKNPESKCYGLYDFLKFVSMYYSSSMLSSRITNDNLYVKLIFNKNSFNDEESLTNLLRYMLLVYASRKVEFLYMDKTTLPKKAIEIVNNFEDKLNSSKFINFSKSKDLHVLTCEKKKEKFDIIWSSSKREIDLTDFNRVFDKFGQELKKDIKITNSPIYAYH
ncbi:hypothetical protein ACH5BK_12585 [Arcobacter sp. YIC-80]|uniref:hypothetical protein n=1 Tax=Arcobacter sp. YIC-80 TaxID=3376683 RepID=UPI00384BFD4C